MEGAIQLRHEVCQQGVVIDVQFLQVDVDALEVVFLANVEHALDKLRALRLVAHDPADGVRIELPVVVVGQHRHDRDAGASHLAECLFVDAHLQPVG